jgi:hypothetical protein
LGGFGAESGTWDSVMCWSTTRVGRNRWYEAPHSRARRSRALCVCLYCLHVSEAAPQMGGRANNKPLPWNLCVRRPGTLTPVLTGHLGLAGVDADSEVGAVFGRDWPFEYPHPSSLACPCPHWPWQWCICLALCHCAANRSGIRWEPVCVRRVCVCVRMRYLCERVCTIKTADTASHEAKCLCWRRACSVASVSPALVPPHHVVGPRRLAAARACGRAGLVGTHRPRIAAVVLRLGGASALLSSRAGAARGVGQHGSCTTHTHLHSERTDTALPRPCLPCTACHTDLPTPGKCHRGGEKKRPEAVEVSWIVAEYPPSVPWYRPYRL